MFAFFLLELCPFSHSNLPLLLQQMMTGVLPFDGASAAQVLESISNASAPPVGGIFSKTLKILIARMLEKVFFCLWGVMFFSVFRNQ
jgi:hypothetical protein